MVHALRPCQQIAAHQNHRQTVLHHISVLSRHRSSPHRSPHIPNLHIVSVPVSMRHSALPCWVFRSHLRCWQIAAIRQRMRLVPACRAAILARVLLQKVRPTIHQRSAQVASHIRSTHNLCCPFLLLRSQLLWCRVYFPHGCMVQHNHRLVCLYGCPYYDFSEIHSRKPKPACPESQTRHPRCARPCGAACGYRRTPAGGRLA